jgi:hypothetical protein
MAGRVWVTPNDRVLAGRSTRTLRGGRFFLAEQTQQRTSADRFVLKKPDADLDTVRKSLHGVAAVEPLTKELLVVTPRRKAANAAEGWRRIRDAVKSAEWVAPVVIDREGRPSYPTGTLGVRFASAPSDSELEEFAARHGLEVLHRNQYVPEQAVFAPGEPRATFLPELVGRLDDDEHVKRAWPETLSSYEHVDRG